AARRGGRPVLALRAPYWFVHVLAQHVERDVAAEDDGVVERLEIVLRSQRGLDLLALTVDLAVDHLVAAGLSGPRAIAIDFAGDFLRVRAIDVDEEPDPLLARPALG